MASLNKVFLMGNITRDPELRHATEGTALCSFGIAVNRKYTSQGVEKEEVAFIDIDVWGKQAESCGKYLAKGHQVLIDGRLRYDQWEDKETKRPRSRLVVVAERCQFLTPKKNEA